MERLPALGIAAAIIAKARRRFVCRCGRQKEAQTKLQNASGLAVINADSPPERPKNYGTDIA
ncbi:hypothetical protein CHX27_05125 [Flavobacterium aurantiibacter]|uniref:Uncharacterized protein n=1 Tax=Flavobacterium aurantiibacter TaxID=2023067 RepID=A0A255ZZ26_9FLAO|nr:hypothetical protein CHX27_05125 [Flavobacterium aurantiibacter]